MTIPIDKKIIEQARNTDMVSFLEQRCGYAFAHQGGAYRCIQHPSLAVKEDRLSFFWHSKGIGGFGTLDYLMKVENMPFRDAVAAVAGMPPITALAQPNKGNEKPKSLILPEKSGLMLRLYDYLCNKRSIHSDIVQSLIQKEMLYEDRRGNVVFIGYDEHNKPRFATLRGTHGSYRGDCPGSDKRYSFNTGSAPSGRLYLFESAIDLMSHASLAIVEMGDRTAWEYDNRLSLAGTADTAVPFFLNQHKTVKELVLCLDNDPAGREAAAKMAGKYAYKGYTVLIQLPQGKDFNIDLQAAVKQIQAEKSRKLNNNIYIQYEIER